MDIAEAKERLRIPDLWQRLDLPGQPKASCKSPFREDRRASFSVSRDGLLFNDFTTGEAGDAIVFLQLATGLSPCRCPAISASAVQAQDAAGLSASFSSCW